MRTLIDLGKERLDDPAAETLTELITTSFLSILRSDPITFRALDSSSNGV